MREGEKESNICLSLLAENCEQRRRRPIEGPPSRLLLTLISHFFSAAQQWVKNASAQAGARMEGPSFYLFGCVFVVFVLVACQVLFRRFFIHFVIQINGECESRG